MNDYYVYRYIRLDNQTPFYVGKGRKKRADQIKNHNKWCKRIASKHGFEIEYILEDLTEDQAHAKEKEFIKFYRNAGYELTNLTDGGEGSSGCYPTAVTRSKMSAARSGELNPMFGKTFTPEHIAKISEALKGKPLTEKTKIKISLAGIGRNSPNKGKVLSSETCKKMSSSHIGLKHSEETKDKISAALKGELNPMFGKIVSIEIKTKISNAISGENNPMFGKTHSKETIALMSSLKTGENHPLFGKHRSEETKSKIGNAQRGKPRTYAYKKVQCIETGEIFESVQEASKILNIDPKRISSSALSEKVHKKSGLSFRYIKKEL